MHAAQQMFPKLRYIKITTFAPVLSTVFSPFCEPIAGIIGQNADLAAAFSIPVSVKPAAGVRWAIRDGPHKNMQAGKRGILY